MNFEAAKRRVERAELLVSGRGDQAASNWKQLKFFWANSWTPARIVIAGLGTGYVVGKAEPVAKAKKVAGKVGGARWLQMITSLSGMAASLHAAVNADLAKDSADTAADNADDAATAAAEAPRAAAQAAHAGARQSAMPNADIGFGAELAAPSWSGAPLPTGRHPLDEGRTEAPRPAEAATDVSER